MDGLHGNDESLYIKCLFRTINFIDLKQELSSRQLHDCSDSYYVMCLRLRLHLLQDSSSNKDIISELKSELETLKKKSVGYICSLAGCSFVTKNYSRLIHHLKSLHSGTNQKITCQLRGCSRELSSVKMLDVHIKASHRTRRSTVCIKQSQLAEQLSTLACLSPSCGHQRVQSVKGLKIHLRSFHTDKKQEVGCIFMGCNFTTQKSGTLKSHFSIKHPLQLINDLKSDIVKIDDDFNQHAPEMSSDLVPSPEGSSYNIEHDEEAIGEEEVGGENDEDDSDQEDDGQDIFTKALAMTFNTWANVKNIAHSTVGLIVTEVFNSYQQGVDVTKKKVKRLLANEGIDMSEVDKLLEELEDDPFLRARDDLETEAKRKKFILTSFENVKPVTVRLNKDIVGVKPETMQYIPIKQTLKLLLEDESYNKQKREDQYFHEPDVIKDVKDGKNFRNNKFFRENPTAVPLLFFQDELEVVNPLGAGKNKHKIQCTYWTSLDIIPAFRTKIKSVQLCSLVLSKYWKKYGNGPTIKNMLEDLKDLETVGLKLEKPIERIVKAGLAMVVGDNLGQHQLGEMNSVFSSGFICRYCDASYEDVCKNGKIYSGCESEYESEELTEKKYDEYADLAVERGGPSKDTHGVKGHCLLNQLKSFHNVSNMPPCLGHDYFEGIFAYDVQHYLDHLLNKEKLMTIDEFNAKLSRVKLSERDAKNRPKNFKKRSVNCKYEGNAGSLRVLSRVLTTVLSDVLEDSETQNYLIKLHEVGEIITAPSLTVYEIENIMTDIITDYLDLRREGIEALQMPRPRPKHHFLFHYPRMFLNNGPLIKVWAMRMESKHTFFKSVLRTARNFKNVALTCATRHQMAQISFYYYGLFSSSKFEVPDDAPNVNDVLRITSDSSLRSFYGSLQSDAVIPKKLKVFGTGYGIGKVLVLNKLCFGKLRIGVIKAIAFSSSEVNFSISVFEAHQSKFGYYVTTKFVSPNDTVNYSNLADYRPLEMIGTNKSFSFILHHFITTGAQQE